MSIFTYTTDLTDDQRATADGIVAIAVEHSSECSHKSSHSNPDSSIRELNPDCVTGEKSCRIGYVVETFKGKVISKREKNGYHDSDFFATVVTSENPIELKSIAYATTRGWTYFNSASIDASEELQAKVEAHKAEKKAAWNAKIAAEAADLDSKTPTVGKTVKVISKRSKIAFGTTGEVVWFGASQYANFRPNSHTDRMTGLNPNYNHPANRLADYRVGIRLEDGSRVFASATCFEIVESDKE